MTGNITADYFFGNGSQLTGLDYLKLDGSNANQNVNIGANGFIAEFLATEGLAIDVISGVIEAANGINIELRPATGQIVEVDNVFFDDKTIYTEGVTDLTISPGGDLLLSPGEGLVDINGSLDVSNRFIVNPTGTTDSDTIIRTDIAGGKIFMDRTGTGGTPSLSFRVARGTTSSKALLQNNDVIMRLDAYAWNTFGGGSYPFVVGSYEISADGNHSAGPPFSAPTKHVWKTSSGVGTSQIKMTLDKNGSLFLPQVYNDANVSTARDLCIQADGKLTYCASSSIIYKENIANLSLSDTSWIYDLQPKIYDRIDGSRENEIGLIAQDVALINPDLVTYKRITTDNVICNWVEADNEKQCYTEQTFTISDEPETVEYGRSDFIVSLISEVQNLKSENDLMKASLCKLGEVQFC